VTSPNASTPGQRLERLNRELVECRRCPAGGVVRARGRREARRLPRSGVRGRPVPGLGDPAARLPVLGLARPPTAATTPGGSSPATARETGCSGACTAPASPTSRPRSPAATGPPCATATSPRRSSAPRPTTGSFPRSVTTARRG
jgi:hypothetical protein